MFFRIILLVVGLALSLGSRLSPRVRSQLSRDMIFVLESLNGVSRSFVVRGRRVSSHSGVQTSSAVRMSAVWISSYKVLTAKFNETQWSSLISQGKHDFKR